VAVGCALLQVALAQQPQTSSAPSSPTASSSASGSQKTAAKPNSGTAKPPTKTASTLALKTDKDKASYALGLNFASSLKRQSVDADVDAAIVARGLRDGLGNGKHLLTDDEARSALTALQTQVRNQQQAKMQEAGDANKKEGDAFLAENKSKDGVVTLPSGLQYKILKEGNGSKPTATDSVVCNYRGTLINGTEFDSSYKRGQPATFPVGGVIKGWTEALQLMPVGSKWQLFVPSDLAYGPRGAAGGAIGPNATLIFEVELLSIQEKPKAN
jgi:FKBP-type peptidyl-prolyl cis-trans isomerase FklB